MWDKSTTDIILQSPFLAKILMTLEMVKTENVETMATDGRVILWNQTWCATVSKGDLDGVRVHECLHVLLGHHVRRGQREPHRWNVACDYEINPYVIDAGYTLPNDALIDDAYSELSAEEIYERLPPSLSLPAWGAVVDGGDTPEEIAVAKDAWRKLASSSHWGTLPAGLSRALREKIQPRPDVADAITTLLASVMPGEDETWSPPDRRNPLLPSPCDVPDGRVAICVDTSGSIRDNDLEHMASMVMGLAGVGRTDVIFGDCNVTAVHEDVSCLEDIASAFANATGGGGTDFRPLIAAANALDPDITVYLTDGAGEYGSPPDRPVIWALTRDATPPYGQTIRLNGISA